MTDEQMECGCRLVRCDNPDCRQPIYATDGVCRACAVEPCPEPGCEYLAGHEQDHPHGYRLMCANGCTAPAVVTVQLPGRVKSVCEWCAAPGGDEDLLEATAILSDASRTGPESRVSSSDKASAVVAAADHYARAMERNGMCRDTAALRNGMKALILDIVESWSDLDYFANVLMPGHDEPRPSSLVAEHYAAGVMDCMRRMEAGEDDTYPWRHGVVPGGPYG